jgi:hypothetical protein
MAFPAALPNDGLVDLCILEGNVGYGSMTSIFGDFQSGQHFHNDDVSSHPHSLNQILIVDNIHKSTILQTSPRDRLHRPRHRRPTQRSGSRARKHRWPKIHQTQGHRDQEIPKTIRLECRWRKSRSRPRYNLRSPSRFGELHLRF